jgi:hypothetical protein
MTTRADLRDLTVAALTGQTAAGARVYTPADWPTVTSDYPAILVRAPREDREAWRRGGAYFTCTAAIRIVAKVQALAQADDFGAEIAEEACERLEAQILRAVINNPAIMDVVQKLASIRSQVDVDSSGETHLAELTVEIDMEYVAGPDDFYPDATVPLAGVDVTLDAVDVFDATATFPNPTFPDAVLPAPRTSGPDGRAEAGLTLDLPQT